MSSEGRASLTGVISATDLQGKRGSLTGTAGPRGSTDTLDRAHMLREVRTSMGGMPISVPSDGLSKELDTSLAVGLVQKSINGQGVIAVPGHKTKPDRAIAEAVTLSHVNKMGEKTVDASKVPLDTGLARASLGMALNSGVVKSADPSKAPTGEPSKELLACIQKEANESSANLRNLRKSFDLSALGDVTLKEAPEQKDQGPSESMKRAGLLNEISTTSGGQPISVPAGKVKTLEAQSQHVVATAIMHKEINKQGIIACPAENVPDTSPTTEQIESIQQEVREIKESQQEQRKSIDLSALQTAE